MGTYTTNKNLFMPSVGETGWGTLVNNNFSTIDTFLKPISLSGSTYTFTGSHVGNQSGGSISATSITNSGTSTFTGKITANGGIGTTSLTTSSTITSTGKITANGGIGTKALTATTGTFSGAITGATITLPAKSSGGFSFINLNFERNITSDITEIDYLTISAVTSAITPLGSVIPDGAYVTLTATIVNSTTARTITLIVNDKQYTATLSGVNEVTLFNSLKVVYPTSVFKIRTSVQNQGFVRTTLKMVSYL